MASVGQSSWPLPALDGRQVEAANAEEVAADSPGGEAGADAKPVTTTAPAALGDHWTVHLSVKDLRVQYEDRTCSPHCPFAIGLTLAELAADVPRVNLDLGANFFASLINRFKSNLKLSQLAFYHHVHCAQRMAASGRLWREIGTGALEIEVLAAGHPSAHPIAYHGVEHGTQHGAEHASFYVGGIQLSGPSGPGISCVHLKRETLEQQASVSSTPRWPRMASDGFGWLDVFW